MVEATVQENLLLSGLKSDEGLAFARTSTRGSTECYLSTAMLVSALFSH